MTTKQRNFKKSTIDIDAAEKTKLANDAARALETNYKKKIDELQAATNEMATIALKYSMSLDVGKLGPSAIALGSSVDHLKAYLATIGNTIGGGYGYIYEKEKPHFESVRKSCINQIENSYDLTETKNLLENTVKVLKEYKPDYYNYNNLLKISEQLEELINAVDTDALAFFSKTGVPYSQLPIHEAAEYMIAIDKFLDIYSDILDMDPRNENEKSKGFKEYAANILKETKSTIRETLEKVVEGDITGLANNAAEGIANTATAIKDGVSSVAYSFGSFITSFFTSAEDKKFFADMPKVDAKKIETDILNNEADEVLKDANQDQDENEFQVSLPIKTQVILPIADPSKVVKLTDVLFSNAVHNNNQAEARNIIETSKAVCVESAAVLQKYVIQHCKGKNALATPEKCEEYNYRADLVMKNCAVMFPMETSYDKILNDHIQLAVSEGAIITESGAITYVGAGAEIYHQNNFIPQITPERAIEIASNNNPELMFEDNHVNLIAGQIPTDTLMISSN